MNSELNFYKYDVGFNNDTKKVQVGGNANSDSEKEETNIIRKYRKRCLEHQKRIDELEKENKLLKQKIKEYSE
tara:strand:- start:1855 stop:2073 length:219 start_codon:yes stop_codon:yes gene_type:complete